MQASGLVRIPKTSKIPIIPTALSYSIGYKFQGARIFHYHISVSLLSLLILIQDFLHRSSYHCIGTARDTRYCVHPISYVFSRVSPKKCDLCLHRKSQLIDDQINKNTRESESDQVENRPFILSPLFYHRSCGIALLYKT